jgi:hypothetical protein
MKYTKPQITNNANASVAIMNTQEKTAVGADSLDPFNAINPAYSADE